MSRVTLDAQGFEVEEQAVAPRRVLLSASALDRLADLGGVESPAAQMATTSVSVESLGDRLGTLADREAPTTAPDGGPEPHADAAQHDEEPDLDAVLAGAGLVADGEPTETGRAVLDVWHRPALAVELEMLLATRHGRVRARSWHRNLDTWVVCLSSADGRTFELTWCAVDDWWLELGRVAWVDPQRFSPPDEPADTLPDAIETPWELLLATGEAVDRNRVELVDQLVADYAGRTTAGHSVQSLVPAADSDVRTWHVALERMSRGRLHAAVLARSQRGRPGAGIIEWVLFPDGWRSLTPFKRDGWNMVRIERKGPQDLGRDLAVLAAELTS
ncbi:hypothetical protein [Nocardioides sp.]|uniref:hypothetical protein n=1 Tax=Nocardioides sp. TaxID=35761 RepID=UPI002D805A2C|nr:hypothetical protein [Nocardioides sp.]